MGLIVVGVCLTAFIASGAIWWCLGIAALLILTEIGEESIMSWLFFVSVIGGIIWLVAKYLFGVEL